MSTLTNTDRVKLEIAGQSVELSSKGTAYVVEQRTLLVADLHLGKTTTFRRAGIPIPDGPTRATTNRLLNILKQYSPDTLVVLGI